MHRILNNRVHAYWMDGHPEHAAAVQETIRLRGLLHATR